MKLGELVISPFNIRQHDTEDDLTSLTDSIKKRHLISKLLLRPGKKGVIEIVAGYRRYRAMMELHGKDYDLIESEYVLYDELSDEDALVLSIEENQQRKNLSPLELNRAALTLNQKGYKDAAIAKILNVTPHRLKRLYVLSADINKIPDVAKEELKKTVEESKFTDGHWDKMRNLDDPAVVKDVVDLIMEKELPPRDVPTAIKAIEKKYEDTESAMSGEKKDTKADAPADGVIEYEHKGELVLEKKGNKEILKVIGKEEDSEVPVEHYLEYLRHPEKFKCRVTFKLKIRPIE